MSKSKFVKGATVLSVGNIAGALSSFLRNIIVARLISVEDFGVAATFAMAMTLLEASSNLAVDRLIVQAADGENPKLQASAQLFLFFRGAISAIILYSIASPTASLFGVPEVTWAYQILALVPLIMGFAHLDRVRFQRKMHFGKYVFVETGPHLFATLLAAPLAIYFNDYRVMLCIVIIQAACSALLSHFVAERKYEWAWDWTYIVRMYQFGWPLLLNGFLIFGIFQGDRLLIGSFFGMEVLGWFSAAFSVTMVPSLVITKVCQSFLLPLISQIQNKTREYQVMCVQTTQITLLFGCLLSVGFATIGPTVFVLLFGEQYEGGKIFIAWLGLMQGFRVAKAGPAIVAMANADTKIPMYANIVRGSALFVAFIAVSFGVGVFGIVLCAVIGEFSAFIVSILLLNYRTKISKKLSATPILLISFVMIFIFFVSSNFHTEYSIGVELGFGLISLLVVPFICLAVMPELAGSVSHILRNSKYSK